MVDDTTEPVSIVYNENEITIIQYEPYGSITLTEENFEELAYKIRQTPYGK